MALADSKPIADFGDPAAEARACRTACALFDFSFLECARIQGAGARQLLEAFTGRPLASLEIGRISYALRIGPAGEAIADLTIWRIGDDRYEVMSGRREDIADLLACAESAIAASEGADTATFALQGPASLDISSRYPILDSPMRRLTGSPAGSAGSATRERPALKSFVIATGAPSSGRHSRLMRAAAGLSPWTCFASRPASSCSATN